MTGLAARLAGASGWRRVAVLFLLGAVGAAAMPPLSLTPALLVAFTGFVWILDGSSRPIRAAIDGWWFGFGFLVPGLYWIAYALMTDVAQFWWLLPLAVLGLPALLALFPALAGAAAYFLWLPGAARVVSLAVAWTLAEWLRGHVFTGFPWNLVGYTWTWSDEALQTASLIGVYGLSFFTVLLAATFAAFSDAPAARPSHAMARGRDLRDGPSHSLRPPAGPGRWWLAGFGTVCVAGGILFGVMRLAGADGRAVDGVELRVVQANIAQAFKWQPEEMRANLERHLVLTRSPGIERMRVVIWSETAMPYALDDSPELRAALGGLLSPGALLVTGVPRVEMDASGRFLSGIWNSVAVLDSAGTLVGGYDKAHLVPFGEYVPLRPILAALGLGKVVPGVLDYSPGPGLLTLELPGLPSISPLVCYEVIFPGAVALDEPRPGWLLNLTNDAWYGHSAGPYQHFAMARVRAVEEGLPLVRAANTGISGVIDAYGRVRARLGLQETGALDAFLPVALPPTFYARWGDSPLVVFLSIAAVFNLAAAAASRSRGNG